MTSADIYHAFITGRWRGHDRSRHAGGVVGYSSAWGINDVGQVVGDSFTAAGFWHAFITAPNGAGMTDLSDAGGT